jgi:hypothetical protein
MEKLPPPFEGQTFPLPLRNIYKVLTHHTASHPRRQQSNKNDLYKKFSLRSTLNYALLPHSSDPYLPENIGQFHYNIKYIWYNGGLRNFMLQWKTK